MKQIITTVGTSLFTNFQQEEVKNRYGRDYASVSIDEALKRISDEKPKAADIYAGTFKHYVKSIQENIEDYWFGGKFTDNKRASAEIASIIEIAREEPAEQFEVHLVATDTLLSVLAAEMIRDWFSKHKQLAPNVTEVVFQRTEADFHLQEQSDYVVKDLRTDSQSDYENGIMNLLELLNKITKKEAILNITGGYKAIVPIVTVWAQIKKVHLKYLFNENELTQENLKPLTLGQLPLDLDWNIVETLKPVLKNYILKKLNSLAFCIGHSDVVFDVKKQMYASQKEGIEIPNKPKIFHQVLHAVASSKLISISDDKIVLTALGKLFAKAQLSQEDYNGYVMELVLHKLFFGSFRNDQLLKGYNLSKKPENLPKFFKVIDKTQKKVELCNPNIREKKEIGDMDVALEKDGTIVWAEAKAFQAFCTLREGIGKNKDYFFQLKARAKAILESLNYASQVEILVLVFKFMFRGLNDDSFTDSSHFVEVFNHLNALNEDVDIKEKVNFRCIGIKVPVDFQSNRIDFTAFYKCQYGSWEFEEIETTQNT